MIVFGYLRVLRRCLNFTRRRRLSSKQSHCFAINKTIFNAGWMAWIEAFTLKGFSRFVVSFYDQNALAFESFSFEHHCLKESNLVLWYLGREFDSWVGFIDLFNKTIHVFFIAVPEAVRVVRVTVLPIDGKSLVTDCATNLFFLCERAARVDEEANGKIETETLCDANKN